MANEEHLRILKQGVDAWNEWRREHPDIQPDLSGANLGEMAGFSARRTSAERTSAGQTSGWAVLGPGGGPQWGESQWGESQRGAPHWGEPLGRANLSRAHLSGADLGGRISAGRFSSARTSWVALLLETVMNEADLTACRVYGVSAWGIHLEGAKQTNLIITPDDEPEITVDNLEVAQFIYLLLNNEKIREVIDTITSKVVLILGTIHPGTKGSSRRAARHAPRT